MQRTNKQLLVYTPESVRLKEGPKLVPGADDKKLRKIIENQVPKGTLFTFFQDQEGQLEYIEYDQLHPGNDSKRFTTLPEYCRAYYLANKLRTYAIFVFVKQGTIVTVHNGSVKRYFTKQETSDTDLADEVKQVERAASIGSHKTEMFFDEPRDYFSGKKIKLFDPLILRGMKKSQILHNSNYIPPFVKHVKQGLSPKGNALQKAALASSIVTLAVVAYSSYHAEQRIKHLEMQNQKSMETMTQLMGSMIDLQGELEKQKKQAGKAYANLSPNSLRIINNRFTKVERLLTGEQTTVPKRSNSKAPALLPEIQNDPADDVVLAKPKKVIQFNCKTQMKEPTMVTCMHDDKVFEIGKRWTKVLDYNVRYLPKEDAYQVRYEGQMSKISVAQSDRGY